MDPDDPEIIQENNQSDGDNQGAYDDPRKPGVRPETSAVINSASIHDPSVTARNPGFDEISANGGKVSVSGREILGDETTGARIRREPREAAPPSSEFWLLDSVFFLYP
jgi:hypothetical protein